MVTVERAAPDSLAHVRGLLAGFSQAIGEPVADDEAWRRIASAAERGAIDFHVARAARVPVGLASMSVGFSTYRAAPFALLDDVYVVPERRRRGVARALVAALVASARQKGCASILGGCSPGDVPMWERLGFRTIGTLVAKDL